jgi:RHS repeat-associated protein
MTQAAKTGTTVTYAYDHSGQRVKLANGSTTTYYPSKTYNTDGTTPTKHIFDNQGNVVATVKGTGAASTIHYVHTDHLSGTGAVTDSTAALVQLEDYHPFGSSRIGWKHSSYDEQRKFAGHEYDSDTGLSYMEARYYNSCVARFVSQDAVFRAAGDNKQLKQLTGQDMAQALLDPQALNSYGYARNNPLVYKDPDGNSYRSAAWEIFKAGARATAQYAYNRLDRYYDAPKPGEGSSDAAMYGLVYVGKINGKDTYVGFGPGEIAAVGGLRVGGLAIGTSLGKYGKVVEPKPDKITGIATRANGDEHALMRILTRSASIDDIGATVQNPLVRLEQKGGNTLYLSERAGVVLNKNGEIVTAYGSKEFNSEVQAIINSTK